MEAKTEQQPVKQPFTPGDTVEVVASTEALKKDLVRGLKTGDKGRVKEIVKNRNKRVVVVVPVKVGRKEKNGNITDQSFEKSYILPFNFVKVVKHKHKGA